MRERRGKEFAVVHRLSKNFKEIKRSSEIGGARRSFTKNLVAT
jgi:hypothetical protein